MSIYKPNNSDFWYVYLVDQRGKRIRRSTGTTDEKAAQEYHDRLKADMWRAERLKERPAKTFDEAALRWIQEQAHKATIESDKLKIKRLRPFLGEFRLHEITGDDCRQAVENAEGKKPMKPATKNRYLALLRSMLKKAETEWDWIDKSPKIRLYQEPTRRIRWITPEEAQRLISHLPPHLVPIVKVGLATGLRKSNIYHLRWSQIDLKRKVAWIHPDEAKARKAIGVPLNEMAIEAIRSQIGKDPEFVFTFRGKPLEGKSNVGFDEACEAAKIKDFRFHDLRHTWASWLVQSGVGLAELQELGGWESIEMVRRYAHLAPEHLHQHSRKIDNIMERLGPGFPEEGG